MGVAAAYLAEMVNDEMKADNGFNGGAAEPLSRIVVVAPQEGQVCVRACLFFIGLLSSLFCFALFLEEETLANTHPANGLVCRLPEGSARPP